MNMFLKKLKEELSKEDKSTIDFNRCLELLKDIDHEIDMIESESDDYQEMNIDLENEVDELKYKVDELESEIEYFKKTNAETIDDVYKQEIFDNLSKKYTSYQLEELLKKSNI
jgi:hypothetical protein